MSEDFKGAFRKDNPLGGSIIPVRVITLEEAAKFLSGGTPSKSEPEYWTGNIPWVSAKDMKTLLISDTEDHITSEGAAVGSKIAPVGSILILVRGMTLLFDVPICYANRELTFNQDVKALVPRDGVDPRYLMYALLAAKPQLLDHVDQAGHGTGRLATDLLKSLEIRLPDIREQRRIAHILGTLDDRIELNRRMNATLEAVARALFQSWFVDFDPVRAKVEGRQPAGMDAETAALFPDEFEESELGEIPKGWSVGKIGDEFNVTMGQSPPGSSYNEEQQGVPFYQGKVDFGFRFPTERIYCTEPKRFAEKNDTLLTVRAPVGELNLAMDSCCIGRGLAAIRHKSGSQGYTYYFLKELREVFENFNGEGTVFGAITKDALFDLPCVVASETVIGVFERNVQSLDKQIEVNEQQSVTLAALRDALLPRLLSGELSMTTMVTPAGDA